MGSGEYSYHHIFVVLLQILHPVGIERKHRTCLHKNRVFVDGIGALYGLSTLKQRTCGKFKPLALGQPGGLHGVASLHGRGDGRHYHLVAKHILVAEVVCLLSCRVIVVHRAAERNGIIVGASSHGIDIGCHGVALAHGVAKRKGDVVVEHPRLFLELGILGGVCAHNRAHGAELHPAGIHLGVDAVDAVHVSAEVVAPVAIEYIRGCVVEIGLEVKRSP